MICPLPGKASTGKGALFVSMSKEEYKAYAQDHAPRSLAGRNMARAFLVGGGICVLGQLLLAGYSRLGLEKDAAAAFCSITLICLGALITGLGYYDDLARFAGAGSLVPITGFANAVAAPALEFKSEGLIFGTAAKMFIISGPVIVYGISASMVYGLLLCLWQLVKTSLL